MIVKSNSRPITVPLAGKKTYHRKVKREIKKSPLITSLGDGVLSDTLKPPLANKGFCLLAEQWEKGKMRGKKSAKAPSRGHKRQLEFLGGTHSVVLMAAIWEGMVATAVACRREGERRERDLQINFFSVMRAHKPPFLSLPPSDPLIRRNVFRRGGGLLHAGG
ncbi:hypothetical protein NPIL_526171 [Nephila pilipes]|uniref:Uncharacterized protein n=1 Tax=Nephila pilipes TaxID=299642 RepID=A0A8X6PZ16_NEPPI|nr:hypothetical protein NPIL_526171 [Nephila pilipes]